MKVEEMYDKYSSKLFTYLVVKLYSIPDAEDVLQEVFCRLVRYTVRFRLLRNPAAFIFRIARNEAIQFREKNNRSGLGSRNVVMQEIISSVFSGSDPDLKNQIAAALEYLPDEQREVIFLKFYDELTFKEIASVCNISLNTVASRYRYGMDKLRSWMEERL